MARMIKKLIVSKNQIKIIINSKYKKNISVNKKMIQKEKNENKFKYF